jgi:hypothetical protein
MIRCKRILAINTTPWSQRRATSSGEELSLAWQDLKTTFKLEQIQLATNNPHILKITDNFNTSPFQIDHISKDSLYVNTGYGP